MQPSQYNAVVKQMSDAGRLTSRKLAAVLGGILGIEGVGALVAWGGLVEQVAILAIVGIVALAGVGAALQGMLDYRAGRNNTSA